MDYMNLKTTFKKMVTMTHPLIKVKKSKYLDLLKTIFCCQEAKKKCRGEGHASSSPHRYPFLLHFN